jgi:hypothetical protein
MKPLLLLLLLLPVVVVVAAVVAGGSRGEQGSARLTKIRGQLPE